MSIGSSVRRSAYLSSRSLVRKIATLRTSSRQPDSILAGTSASWFWVRREEHNRRKGLIAARGSFNGPQLGALAVLSGGKKDSYNGVDIYFTGGAHGGVWFSFPEPTIALVGDEPTLKAAIDRGTQNAQLDPRLTAKIPAAGTNQDVWFAAIEPAGVGSGKRFVALETVDLVSGGLTLGSVVQLNAEALMRTEKDAQSLAGLIKMFAGMLQSQQQRNPAIARLLPFLQNADAKVEGTAVLFSTSASEAVIEQLLRARQKVASLR